MMKRKTDPAYKMQRREFLAAAGAGALGLGLRMEAACSQTVTPGPAGPPLLSPEAVEAADPRPTGVQDLDMALGPGSRAAFAGICCELEVREAFYFPGPSATLFSRCGFQQAHAIDRHGQPQRLCIGQSFDWSDPDAGNIEHEKMWVLLSQGAIRSSEDDPDPHDEPRLLAFARRPKRVSLGADGLHVEMPSGVSIGALFTAAPFGATRVQTTDRNDTRIQHHYLRSVEFKSHRWTDPALPAAVQKEVDYWYPRLGHVVCDVTPTVQVDEESTVFPFPDVLGGERTRLRVAWWSVREHNRPPLQGYDAMPDAAPFHFPDGTAAIKSIPLPALVSLCLSARSHREALDGNAGDLAPFAWRPGDNRGAVPTMTRLATHAGGYAFMVDEPETERELPPFSSITYWTFGADQVRRRDAVAGRGAVEMALGAAIWKPLGGPDTMDATNLAKGTATTVESWIWFLESDPATVRGWLRAAADSVRTEVCDVPSPRGGKLTPIGYPTGDPRWDVAEMMFGQYGVLSGQPPPAPSLPGQPSPDPPSPDQSPPYPPLVRGGQGGSVETSNHDQSDDQRRTNASAIDDLKFGLFPARWAGAVLSVALQVPDEKGRSMGEEIAWRMVGADSLPLSGDALQRWYHLCRYGSWHEDLWHMHAQAWLTAEWAEQFGIAPMMARLARFLGRPEDYARMCCGTGWELLQAYAMMHSSEVLWRSGCFYTDAAFGDALPQQPGTELWSDVGRRRDAASGFDPDVGVASRYPNADGVQGIWERSAGGNAAGGGQPAHAKPKVHRVFGAFSISGMAVPDSLFYTGRSGEGSSGLLTLCDEGITPDGKGGFKERIMDLLAAEPPTTPHAPAKLGTEGTGGCLFDVFAAPVGTSTPVDHKEWKKLNTAAGGAALDATARDVNGIYAYHFTLSYKPWSDRMLIVLAPQPGGGSGTTGVGPVPAKADSRPPSICGVVFRNGDGSNDWTPLPGAPSFTGARSGELRPGQGGGIVSGGIHHPYNALPGPNAFAASFTRAAATLDSGFGQRHYCRRQMMAEFELMDRYGRTPIPGRTAGKYWLSPNDALCPTANAHWAYWPVLTDLSETVEQCYIPVCDLDLERVRQNWKDVGCTGVGTAGYAKLSVGTALALAFAVKPPEWNGLRPRVDLWPAREPDGVWYRASGDGYSKWGGEWTTPASPPLKVDGAPFPDCQPAKLPVDQSLYHGSATVRWWPEMQSFVTSGNWVPTFVHVVPVALARFYPDQKEGARCRYGRSNSFGASTSDEFTLTLESTGGGADAGKVVTITGHSFKARTLLDPAGRAKDLPYLPAGEELKVSLAGGPAVTIPAQKDGASYTVTGLLAGKGG